MAQNALLCLALVTGVVGGSLQLGVNHARAADDCITESNLAPPKGSRWHYHIDRATNRKCWFLMKLPTAPEAVQTRRTLLTVGRASPQHREQSAAGQTGQRGKHKLSEAEQAALFHEFLRWKEQQGAVNSNAVEPLRGTISP
jgi:hypothetical protein